MDYKNLKITEENAEKIILEHYGIKGIASSLPGEIDFNFRIKTENGKAYVLKISRPDEDVDYLDFQQKLLQHVEKKDSSLIAPKVINDLNDAPISQIEDAFGNPRKVRLLTWVSGRIWDDVNPQLDQLRFSLGAQCGNLIKALIGFQHPKENREFIWDIAQSLWTKDHINLFNKEEKEIISFFQNNFENQQANYTQLRKSIVHNDANNFNVIVSSDLKNPSVKAAIDYGDAIYTQIINDVAITTAYAIMNHEDALDAALTVVKGYHSTFPLLEKELEHLFVCVAMRLIITITRSAINKKREPDNTYLLISEKPAWEVLKKWMLIDLNFAHYSFREVCGYKAHPNQNKFEQWVGKNKFSLTGLFPTIKKGDVLPIDLSVESKWLTENVEFNSLDYFQFKFDQLQNKHPNKIVAGGYLEPRTIYSTSSYDKIGNYGTESRTIHLGIDFWLPEKTPVHSLFDGEILIAINDAGDKEYGGLIILKHRINELTFFSLYGHLSVESVARWNTGDQINKGDFIGFLGNMEENGCWVPHLHFQIMLSMLGNISDFPGVAYYRQINVWKSICPDPNLLFKIEELNQNNKKSNSEILKYRKQHLGKGLSLQYKTPIKMVRGVGPYLIDQFGKKYLDTVNNVAHVGHEHPSVIKAGQDQMALLNTNSRYLHNNINDLAKELIETLPPELNVVHFVNSGSEANELAIRMVKEVTGEKDIIASEIGYHGNTNMCIDISSYKFDGKGGKGAPEYTNIFPLPDSFRGKYQGKNTGKKYAKEVEKQIDIIYKKGRGIGAFIIEPIISCGGQIELPDGFLKKAYESIRKNGGLCISDEVQTGCGRMGKTFWGFQLYDVIPDIITIGKPLGNGHPVAAVVCTQQVANKFANGMEYFNTFGGNPVSCAIGTEVLKTVKREKLQLNALEVGEYLKQELHKLSKEFAIIGHVRGQGLFLGIELVDKELNPLNKHTDYLINRMKDYSILMSLDGPDHNVIKIKPPLVFNLSNAKELIYYLKKVFREDFMRNV